MIFLATEVALAVMGLALALCGIRRREGAMWQAGTLVFAIGALSAVIEVAFMPGAGK